MCCLELHQLMRGGFICTAKVKSVAWRGEGDIQGE